MWILYQSSTYEASERLECRSEVLVLVLGLGSYSYFLTVGTGTFSRVRSKGIRALFILILDGDDASKRFSLKRAFI